MQAESVLSEEEGEGGGCWGGGGRVGELRARDYDETSRYYASAQGL